EVILMAHLPASTCVNYARLNLCGPIDHCLSVNRGSRLDRKLEQCQRIIEDMELHWHCGTISRRRGIRKGNRARAIAHTDWLEVRDRCPPFDPTIVRIGMKLTKSGRGKKEPSACSVTCNGPIRYYTVVHM